MEPNEDRLTKLPDNIVHNILELSCLPIFDLVELGFSSRRWNHLLITMPYLDIRTDLFYSLHPVGIPFNHAFIENITRFITRLLIRQGQSRLVRFSLLSRTLDFDSVQILMWLCLVAGRYVQELDIEFHPSRDFRLPLCVAVNDSLIVLRIALVDKVLQLPSVVRLNRLRSLELYEVAFADSDLLQRLFSGCRALESLSLKDCVAGRFSFLDFSSTYLKELIFDFHQDEIDDFSNFVIKVSCPNLVFFQYSAPIAMRYILEDVYSLKTAFIGFNGVNDEVDRQVGQIACGILKDVQNVTVLHLSVNIVYSLSYVLDELTSQPTSFPNVKYLRMLHTTLNRFTQVMFLLLDHCPNLEVLTLISERIEDAEWNDEHWELQYEGIVSWKSHPHMKTMKFVRFQGVSNEIDLLMFILKNARSLERLDIIWSEEADNVEEIMEKVLMFPKASSGIVVTFSIDDFFCEFENTQREGHVFLEQ